ncbi:thioredoxin domain-containing protein [Streptomyces filamentosus]|uniref:Thioredoxin n=1 Tax=Streptomyces filamentosus TaxID=67294 RepID=A0ABY4UX48_STRFL|nr:MULTISPECIES: thioredoxin domain-containing protein [Streptomyces]ESU46853.1 putative thioredoxin [Streptomyces sp. HCCB10043]EWS94609.1 thioredoxin [Streptomyces filamentosus NRRL 11379]MYR81604.1 thiol reductase thioredoxin [Streptomyces sp. SID5466]USC46934.1 thioredoxin domain-containing protein [Streptomyces filamentosus]
MIRTAGLTEVTEETFEAEVLESVLPVLVQFTADWCGPCRQLAPVLGEISREEADRIRVVQLDVDRAPGITVRYGVLATPTLMVFRAGEPVTSLVGARPKRKLLRELADILAPVGR